MRLSELSERSGVPVATVKYYLREGLLPAGERVGTTRAEYGEEHLWRLGLVRALVQVAKIPIATVRAVLAAVDAPGSTLHYRLGAAVSSLPDGVETEADGVEPAVERTVAELLTRLGWEFGLSAGEAYPPYRMLLRAVATLRDLGYPCDAETLLPYARAAATAAEADLDLIQGAGGSEKRIEATVLGTLLYEPVLLSLRRIADAEESNRRFGGES